MPSGIEPCGYAVNNNHVVDHAKTVPVVTDDGKILAANVFSALSES